jgi:hypothetical protein
MLILVVVVVLAGREIVMSLRLASFADLECVTLMVIDIEPPAGGDVNELVAKLSSEWTPNFFRPIKTLKFGRTRVPAIYYEVYIAPHCFFLIAVIGAADDVVNDVISFRNDYGADFVGCVSIDVDKTVDDGVASFLLSGLTDEQLNRCDALFVCVFL